MMPNCIQCKKHLSTNSLEYHECERCKYPVCYDCTHKVNGRPRCPDCVRMI